MIKSTRIESIDILRGLVMVIMALDHTRDYFHYDAFVNNPTNLETTTPFLFFTRFITHYCAPVFVFLAGTSAYLYGTNKSKNQLFKFLITRGIWLIILEIILNNLIWQFNLHYNLIVLQVIWAIGLSMFVLSFLIYLPKKALLIVGVILVVGHNSLDGIVMQKTNFKSIIWYILHQRNRIILDADHSLIFAYPIMPWLGLMILGYCLGTLYKKGFPATRRKKYLLGLGITSVILFFIVRGINIYGDLKPWSVQDNPVFTFLSFMNVTKYPPSLLYILVTIGPALLFLYAIETIKNKTTDFLIVFGRVPLFYYFMHVLVIHTLAILAIIIFSDNWQIITSLSPPSLAKQGYSLFIVYIVWIGVIAILYYPCKKYMTYKANNKNKWWLSYL
ncbi:DUF1624 domain-containing protein [Algibacter mikhailovii]|uniref:DUF1624 domain-containing protein n=1 Tax=Algibacter mikhailovii TaxID=425498 RepID=UPI002494BCE6|nr:heparan-alpha-glucosaminide N-acetyltransferase domain-containing protein [Algibacter mikhailovii]